MVVLKCALVSALVRTLAVSQLLASNVQISRCGDGVATLSSAGCAMFIDEYTTSATSQTTPVTTISLPQVSAGGNLACTQSGSAAQDGYATSSADGSMILLGCYASPPGTASVTSTTTARVVVRVFQSGVVDSSTGLTDVGANNWRTIISRNGSAPFWGFGKNALKYISAIGATTSTSIIATTNFYTGFLFVHPTDGPAVWAGAAAGIYYMGLAPAVTSATTLPAALPLTGAGTQFSEFAFADTQTLWTADSVTGLYEWTAPTTAATNAAMAAATWTKAAGYPVQPGGSGTAGVKAFALRVESGTTVVYCNTAATVTNALWRFVPSTSTWTLLATAPANVLFRAVFALSAASAASPSSTPSASLSSSASLTPSSTPPAGASATSTLSGTPVPSQSPTGTGTNVPSASSSFTPTSSTTPSYTPTASPSAVLTTGPFGVAGVVQVLRVGIAGPTALSSSATPLFIDEFSTAAVSLLPARSIALPATNTSGANWPCTQSGSAGSDGYGTVSVSGTAILLGCYSSAAGTASVTSSLGPRIIASVSQSGAVSTSTLVNMTGNVGNFRGVASLDGISGLYSAGSPGLFYSTAVGASYATALVSSGNFRTATMYPHASGAGVWFGASGGISLMGGGLATSTGASLSRVGVSPGSAVNSIYVASPTEVYAGDDTNGVTRWTLPAMPADAVSAAAATWNASWATPKRPAANVNVKTLTGRSEGSAGIVLYVVTLPASGSNALYSYSVTADVWLQLATSPTNTQFRAAFAFPLPSSSGSPSASTSGTPTRTPSASVTSTNSPTGSATPTSSASGSATLTGTSTTSSSKTISLTGTSTTTNSRSGSATLSSSGSATPTVSISASETSTATSPPSSSGTGTASSSTTGAPSSSRTDSATASTSFTATASLSSSESGTQSTTSTPSTSSSPSVSGSPSSSLSASASVSHSAHPTHSVSRTSTQTATPTTSTSNSVSSTPSSSGTSTTTPTLSTSGSPSASGTSPASGSPTASLSSTPLSTPHTTPSRSATRTRAPTSSHSPTRSPSRTRTRTPSHSPTRSHTASQTRSASRKRKAML